MRKAFVSFGLLVALGAFYVAFRLSEPIVDTELAAVFSGFLSVVIVAMMTRGERYKEPIALAA
jgi:hypothetical protein